MPLRSAVLSSSALGFQSKWYSTQPAVNSTPTTSITALMIWMTVAPGIPPREAYRITNVPITATHRVRVVALGAPVNCVNSATLPTSWATR